MPDFVYAMCAATSLGCAWMLYRSYLSGSSRLLMWCAACFGFLALNNLMLMIDLTIVPEHDLRLLRGATGLAGPLVLVWGLIWEAP